MDLFIRNVPEDTSASLRRQAADAGMTITQYLRWVLVKQAEKKGRVSIRVERVERKSKSSV